MVSCKIGPKTVVGVGSREKGKSGSGDSNCRPPLRKFCSRGSREVRKQRERNKSLDGYSLYYLFFFSLLIRNIREDLFSSLLL